MKFFLFSMILLLVKIDDARVLNSYAKKKCDCFDDLVRLGEAEKRKSDQDKNHSTGLFGGTVVRMDIDSCAYKRMSQKEREYISHLDSSELANFYRRANELISVNCKSAVSYRENEDLR